MGQSGERGNSGTSHRRPIGVAFAALLTLLTWSSAYAAPTQARVGAPMPRFLLETLDGVTVTPSQFAGRPLFINVFASWCPPCRVELPAIVRAHGRFAKEIVFLGVDEQEPPHVAETFARREGMRYTLCTDAGPFEAAYGATQIPTSIFIDRRGIVRFIHRGPISEAQLKAQLARLLQ
jgi:cytochrome c biogenesis protein CcmG/thiol:disulfide interchange protein DsbE